MAGIALDLATVETNIVIFRLGEGLPDAAGIVARAKEVGILVSALGLRTVRAVTHLDVSRKDCERAADRLAAIIENG
jgi:threonine aldolase